MKRILRTFMLLVACVALAAPLADAQRHQGAGHNGSGRERPLQAARSANNGSSRIKESNFKKEQRVDRGRPAGHKKTYNVSSGRPPVGTGGNNRPGVGGDRPGNNHNRPGVGGDRPGNNHNRPGIGGDRPGNNHNRPGVGGNRPGNNHNRPGVGNNRPGNHRPDNPGHHRPEGGNHAVKPGHGHGPHRPPVMRPPHRPHRPPMMRPHYRPVPPPAWRPRRGLPVVRGILGLTFGAAINISLDYLFNNGYTVDGYGNDVVYLRNVPALNYIWTDAALYYGNAGLDASSFYYSTPYYDAARYNSVYNSLVGTYGFPVSSANTGGVMTSTWFGGNNGYVTLSFGAGSGGRFLTTLTFGM